MLNRSRLVWQKRSRFLAAVKVTVIFWVRQHRGVLIDAGRSCKQIENALLTNSIDPRIIGAVFITHEHTDHCSAVKVLASRYNFKVYASQGTLEALERANRLDKRFETEVIENRSCGRRYAY